MNPGGSSRLVSPPPIPPVGQSSIPPSHPTTTTPPSLFVENEGFYEFGLTGQDEEKKEADAGADDAAAVLGGILLVHVPTARSCCAK